jgi:hypothetical protein
MDDRSGVHPSTRDCVIIKGLPMDDRLGFHPSFL